MTHREQEIRHNLRAKRTLSHAIRYVGPSYEPDAYIILRRALDEIYRDHQDLVRASITHRCGKCKGYVEQARNRLNSGNPNYTPYRAGLMSENPEGKARS